MTYPKSHRITDKTREVSAISNERVSKKMLFRTMNIEQYHLKYCKFSWNNTYMSSVA